MFLFLPGILLHEYTHFRLGKLFGGEPYFSEYRYGVPQQVDFNSLDKMSDLGIQVMGGSVVIYPLIVAGIMGMNLSNPDGILRPVSFLTAFLSLGAIGVSWLDIMAAQQPEKWAKYTAGERISRKD